MTETIAQIARGLSPSMREALFYARIPTPGVSSNLRQGFFNDRTMKALVLRGLLKNYGTLTDLGQQVRTYLEQNP